MQCWSTQPRANRVHPIQARIQQDVQLSQPARQPASQPWSISGVMLAWAVGFDNQHPNLPTRSREHPTCSSHKPTYLVKLCRPCPGWLFADLSGQWTHGAHEQEYQAALLAVFASLDKPPVAAGPANAHLTHHPSTSIDKFRPRCCTRSEVVQVRPVAAKMAGCLSSTP